MVIEPLPISNHLKYLFRGLKILNQSMAKLVNVAFRLIVFSIMAYFIVKQVIRYLENNDAPAFAYRKFLDAPKDNYAVTTFCVEDGLGVFDEEYLADLGYSAKDYYAFLSGTELDETNKTKLQKIDFDKSMMKFEDIVKSFKIIGQNATGGGAMLTWKAKIDGRDEMISPPFYKSYQDPQKLCFSRNNSYGPQGIRAHEYLSINKTLLEKLDGKIRVYHHQTDQLMKRICKYIISKDIDEIDFGMLEFWVSQVNVLRKRVDANEPCDPDVNDDQAVLTTTMKKVNCTPPYWMNMIPKNLTFPRCNASADLGVIQKVLTAPDKLMGIFTQYTEPCNKLSSVVTFQEKMKNTYNDNSTFLIVVNYLEEMYQEVTNKRDFDMEMLWSSVGGFVGMFLGYSLWQCPEMLLGLSCIKSLKKK